MTQISTHHVFTCGITTSQAVECWGTVPEAPIPEGDFVQVSAGSNHACGVLGDGSVQCWGNDGPEIEVPPDVAEPER
jgi:hypothetical protein